MASVHIYHEDAGEIRDAVLAKRADLDVRTCTSEAELRERLGEIEVLFAAVLPREGWANAKRLALVQLMGAGIDMLLPSPDLPASVRVAGARGVFADEVAEHAIALMLALVRNLPVLRDRQREHVWKPFAVQTLARKTLVLVGLGEIGRRIAKIASAMGMRVLGVSRHGRPVPNVASVVTPDAIDRMLASADVLCICAPLTPETRHLMSRTQLEAMPAGSLVLSVGRGGIVDEPALLEALDRGHIGGAALDVFEKEPLAKDSPFWTAPNTIVTPHLAGWGVKYVTRCIDVLLENVSRLEKGEPLVNLVDRARGY